MGYLYHRDNEAAEWRRTFNVLFVDDLEMYEDHCGQRTVKTYREPKLKMNMVHVGQFCPDCNQTWVLTRYQPWMVGSPRMQGVIIGGSEC